MWHGLDSPYAWNCSDLGLGLWPRGPGLLNNAEARIDILLTLSTTYSSFPSPLLTTTALLYPRKNPFQKHLRNIPNAFPLHLLRPNPLFQRSGPSVLSPELHARPQPSRWLHRRSGQSRPCRYSHLLCLQKDLSVSRRLLSSVTDRFAEPNLALTAVCFKIVPVPKARIMGRLRNNRQIHPITGRDVVNL